MLCEDKALALSITLSKALAVDRPNIEIAVLASFFSSLAANLGVIIQNRNLCGQAIPSPQQQERFARAVQRAQQVARQAAQSQGANPTQGEADADQEIDDIFAQDEDEQGESLEI